MLVEKLSEDIWNNAQKDKDKGENTHAGWDKNAQHNCSRILKDREEKEQKQLEEIMDAICVN